MYFNLRNELDDLAGEEQYQQKFTVTVNIFVCDYSQDSRPTPWTATKKINPVLLFANSLEMEETIESFGMKKNLKLLL